MGISKEIGEKDGLIEKIVESIQAETGNDIRSRD